MDSQGYHAGAAWSILLSISMWKTIFRVERLQAQNVCAVTLMIWRLVDKDVVSFFKYALNLTLLSWLLSLRRRGVTLTRIFWLSRKRAGCQVLSLDQVEKGHTSFLSAFRFSFHSWLQFNTELVFLVYIIEQIETLKKELMILTADWKTTVR